MLRPFLPTILPLMLSSVRATDTAGWLRASASFARMDGVVQQADRMLFYSLFAPVAPDVRRIVT